MFALITWAIAVLGANVSAFIPDGVLGGLHASRLSGANLNQLRGQVAALETETARLRQENSVLLQRFVLNEQASGEVTRRVGALELTVPLAVVLPAMATSCRVQPRATLPDSSSPSRPRYHSVRAPICPP